MLLGPERLEYVPITKRRRYQWPNQAQLAVYIALNLEHFQFGKGLGAKLAPSSEPDVLNYSWREYGNRVGGWRLLDALRELEFPVALLVNSDIYEHCPELPKEYCKQLTECEVVGHGKSNACKQSDMNEQEEKQYIAEATAILEQHTGQKPEGWLGPWISQSHVTLDLLQEQGYKYTLDWCHDDAPTWLNTRSGSRILSIPYSQEINDIPAVIARQVSATDFAEMIIDQFDEMLEQSQANGGQPLVLGIALHPYIVGQPFRLRQLKRALKHIAVEANKPDQNGLNKVWLTTPGSIMSYIEGHVEEGTIPGSHS